MNMECARPVTVSILCRGVQSVDLTSYQVHRRPDAKCSKFVASAKP